MEPGSAPNACQPCPIHPSAPPNVKVGRTTFLTPAGGTIDANGLYTAPADPAWVARSFKAAAAGEPDPTGATPLRPEEIEALGRAPRREEGVAFWESRRPRQQQVGKLVASVADPRTFSNESILGVWMAAGWSEPYLDILTHLAWSEDWRLEPTVGAWFGAVEAPELMPLLARAALANEGGRSAREVVIFVCALLGELGPHLLPYGLREEAVALGVSLRDVRMACSHFGSPGTAKAWRWFEARTRLDVLRSHVPAAAAQLAVSHLQGALAAILEGDYVALGDSLAQALNEGAIAVTSEPSRERINSHLTLAMWATEIRERFGPVSVHQLTWPYEDIASLRKIVVASGAVPALLFSDEDAKEWLEVRSFALREALAWIWSGERHAANARDAVMDGRLPPGRKARKVP